MLPETGLPEPHHPKPAEPKSWSIPLYYHPSISGPSEPASGLPFSKPPSPKFFANCLPNYICKMLAVFLAAPPLKSGQPTAPSNESPVEQILLKAMPCSMVVNQVKPVPPALGQHAAKPAVVGPEQEPPPPPPIPPKKPPAGLPPEYRAGPQPVK